MKDTGAYRPRQYRRHVCKPGLAAFRVVVQETDLHLQTDAAMETLVRERVIYYRGVLESYIRQYPDFATSLTPWRRDGPTPPIVADMVTASRMAGTGPMAAVAGAMAACVGADLLAHSREVIVENGGDVFVCTMRPVTVGIYAGCSPLNLKVGIRAGGGGVPAAVCTSSGTIGHSLSFGKADAVSILADACTLADAVATAAGNRVAGAGDIRPAIEWARRIAGVRGVLVIIGDKMGAWGDLELVPLSGKKG